MKKFYGVILALLISHGSVVKAQNVLTSEANLMRSADSICMQRMEYSYAGEKGKNKVWDFSSQESLSGEHPIEYSSDSIKTYQKVEDRGINKYVLDSIWFKQVVSENRLKKINYEKGKLAMKFPLHYGDSIVSEFCGNGRYCGDHKVREEGQVLL